MGQVVPRQDLEKILGPWRDRQKIVFTNGCFDLLHVGHVRYLQEARALGDRLVIGLNSDSSVKVLKGADRPIQNEGDRAEILAALACVDVVVIFEEETAHKVIEQVKPNIYVKGGDWSVDTIKEAPIVLKMGGEVKSLPFHKGRSSSSLIQKILTLG